MRRTADGSFAGVCAANTLRGVDTSCSGRAPHAQPMCDECRPPPIYAYPLQQITVRTGFQRSRGVPRFVPERKYQDWQTPMPLVKSFDEFEILLTQYLRHHDVRFQLSATASRTIENWSTRKTRLGFLGGLLSLFSFISKMPSIKLITRRHGQNLSGSYKFVRSMKFTEAGCI